MIIVRTYILISLLSLLLTPISFASRSVVNEKVLTASEPIRLGIRDFIKLVREKNNKIIYQRLECEISSEAVKNARSIFEPEFVASYTW